MARRRLNPPALHTAGIAAAAAVISSAVTYVVLREVFIGQVTQECLGALQGSTAPSPAKPRLAKRVRAIL